MSYISNFKSWFIKELQREKSDSEVWANNLTIISMCMTLGCLYGIAVNHLGMDLGQQMTFNQLVVFVLIALFSTAVFYPLFYYFYFYIVAKTQKIIKKFRSI